MRQAAAGDVRALYRLHLARVHALVRRLAAGRDVDDIVADTTGGRIALRQLESENVEATAVNGTITYEGSAAAGGSYRLSTHNGGITVVLPETAGAAFAVRTYGGSMRTNLPRSSWNPSGGRFSC